MNTNAKQGFLVTVRVKLVETSQRKLIQFNRTERDEPFKELIETLRNIRVMLVLYSCPHRKGLH